MSKFVSLGFRGDSPWRIPLHCGALLIILAALLGVGAPAARAQSYVQNSGLPTFTTALPVEHGIVNLASGQVHLEIPLGSYPQRGGGQDKAAWYYDSGIWAPVYGTWQYQPATHFNTSVFLGGWGLRSMVDSGISDIESYPVCPKDGQTEQDTLSSFLWVSGDGTVRSFPTVWISISNGFTTACGTVKTQLSSDGYAGDGSGYHLYAAIDATFTDISISVYAPDGTIVYRYPNLSGNWDLLWDTNGNHYYTGPTENQDLDTVGRPIPQMTSSGNAPSNITIWYALQNSQGGTDTYTATGVEINVSTKFGVSGLTEYSGVMYVMQSLQMPDGTSYSFKYDCDKTSGNSACGSPTGQSAYYGLLTSMSLPTGGTINYTYQMFKDADGNPYTRINSRKTQDGTWTYTPSVITSPTCSSTQVNCQQKVTVTKPSGDQAVYTFTLNGGAWPTEVQYYNGAVSSANLVDTSTQCFSFVTVTNGQCSYTVQTASSALNVTKTASTMTLPNGENTTTEYAYDGYGNVTQVSEWNFYSGTLPTVADRTTTTTYLNTSSYINKNILNRPTSVTVKDKNGTTLAQTNYSYDQSALTSVTGVVNHDDADYGTGYTTRGNLTQIQRLVSGSTYLTRTMTYDTTGQLRTSTDWNNNTTAYTYTDNFFNDNGNGSNPVSYTPATPTNAYLTTIQPPLIPASNFGYYFGTGQTASSKDANGNTTYSHFYDAMNRPTATTLPNQGWSYFVYPSGSETQLDVGSGITSTTLSIGSTGSVGDCRHDQTKLDTLGRAINQILVSDPDGQTEADTTYDSNGRVKTVSNPYRGSQNGVETPSYDGLDRVLKSTHADGNIAYTYYGAAVGSNGGLGTQACSGNGLGYPMLHVDEAGRKRQTWTDAFGRLIEADEPDATGSLSAHTCYTYDLNNNLTGVTAAGGTQTRSYTYDLLSRPASKTDPETGTTYFYYTTSSGGLCSGDPTEVCRRTDAKSITTTYTYDALNRPTSKTYTDSTPSVTHSYDQTSYNGLTITNGKGRRTGMSDGSGQTAWSYDTLGNILTEKRTINGQTKVISYTYNLDSSIASINYPSGRTIHYAPGGAGRPLSAKDTVDSINYASQSSLAEYAPQGSVSSVVYGYVSSSVFTGITESRTYNNRLQLTRVQAISSTSTALNLGLGYPTANNGNINTLTDNLNSGQTQTYTYDPLNRLLTAQSQAISGSLCWGQSYGNNATPPTLATDALANLFYSTSTQCLSYQPRYTMNSNNSNQFTGTGISYDLAGNNTADGMYSYTFDAENRITSASGMSGGPYCYKYDGDGLRVAKSNGTSCTSATVDVLYWRNIAGNTIAETDSTGSTTDTNYQEYVFFAGRRIARSNPASAIQYYYFVDQTGSTRSVAEVNPSNSPTDGTVCFSETYYPYGQEQNGSYTAGCGQNYQFTGYERDAETGLDYAFARYYNDRLGRFMSADPLPGDPSNPQSLNRYAYVLNNPVNATDPTGMDSCPDFTCTVSFGGGGDTGFGGGGFYSGPYIGQGGFGGVIGGGASVGGLPSNAPNGTVYDPWGVPVCVFNNGVCGAPIYPASHTPLSAAAAPTCGLFNCPEPKGPPPQPAQPSWWGTFAKSLFSAPTTGSGSCFDVFQNTVTGPLKQLRTFGQQVLPVIVSGLQAAPVGAASYVQQVKNMISAGAAYADEAAPVLADVTAVGVVASVAAPIVSAAIPYALPAAAIGISSVGLGKELWAGFHGQCSW